MMVVNSMRLRSQPWLIHQEFERTGFQPEIWQTLGLGTIDPNYTTNPAPLAGTQSLYLAFGNQTRTIRTFGSQGAVYSRFMFRTSSATNANTRVCSFLNSGGAEVAALFWTAAGRARLTSGGVNNDSATNFPVDTTVYCWFEYIKGTGANGIARFGWNTTNSKPTLVASGTDTCAVTTSTATTDATSLRLGWINNVATIWQMYDDVFVNTTPF